MEFDIQIKYVQKPGISLRGSMVEALASGRGPDVVIFPYGEFIDYRKHLLPLPETFITERDFYNTFIEQAEVYIGEEGTYALPLIIDPMVMYWNRNIFASNAISQVPKVWDEFKTLTPKITILEEGTDITRSTIPFGEYVNVTHAKDSLSMLIMLSQS